jgi:hypothetical protein
MIFCECEWYCVAKALSRGKQHEHSQNIFWTCNPQNFSCRQFNYLNYYRHRYLSNTRNRLLTVFVWPVIPVDQVA